MPPAQDVLTVAALRADTVVEIETEDEMELERREEETCSIRSSEVSLKYHIGARVVLTAH